MKFLLIKYFLFIIVLFAVHPKNNAQSPQESYQNTEIKERKINPENWKKTVDGLVFDEKRKVPEEKKELEPPPANTSSTSASPSPERGSALWAGFFKILFFVIIIAAVALLIVYFLGSGVFKNPKNKKITSDNSNISIEDIEENIYESDLDRFIREASEEQNYALAIRLYYLAIIKELALNKLIRWKKDKTNRDYLLEMRLTNIFYEFREATRIFERIWYGEEILKEDEYDRVKPKFEALVKTVQSGQISKQG